MLSTVSTFFCTVQTWKFRPTFSRLYNNRTGTNLNYTIDKLRQYRANEQRNYKETIVTLPGIDTERMKKEKNTTVHIDKLHHVSLKGAQYKINMYLQRSESSEFYRNLVHT